jgi:hypothetical protein
MKKGLPACLIMLTCNQSVEACYLKKYIAKNDFTARHTIFLHYLCKMYLNHSKLWISKNPFSKKIQVALVV